MLPAEILALVLIASRAHAFPQAWAPLTANATSTPPGEAPTTATLPEPTHTEITESSFDTGGDPTTTSADCTTDGCTIDCVTASCMIFPIQNEVPTETGFENTSTDVNGEPTSTGRPGPASNIKVVTTSTPFIVDIQTSVAPTAVSPRPSDTNVQPAPTGESTQTWEQEGPNAPEVTASDGLLSDIISIIAPPEPKPSVANNDQVAPGNADPQQQVQQGTTNPVLSITAAPGAQPTVTVGQSMTLAGATLTLTPGLSTTVGTGPAATYIEIISDAAGQTIITLSSSGTAVTATVTNAPTTMTVASDFDASLTAGDHDSSSVGAAATTSSTAGAVDIKDGTSWMVHLVVGIVGLSAAL